MLNSNAAPDILEYNKGNATAGLLASQGLLTNLDDAVEEYGWDNKLAPSLQTTAKYDDKGIMGSGDWYGIPNYGEFVEVYYNKDMFAKYGIEVPTTYDEFEAALQTFKDNGITPLAEVGRRVPARPALVPARAEQGRPQWVDDYQLYKGKVDWQGAELSYATETVKDWVDKGYISKDVTGIKAEDAGTAFISGDAPDLLLGQLVVRPLRRPRSRTSSGARSSSPAPTWRPARPATCGSSPRTPKNKDLAYKFIDITMRPEIQAIIGNNGGVPVAADTADITDPKSQELIANFNTLTERDGLAFYPDWPTPTFYDQLNAGAAGARQRHEDARARCSTELGERVPGRRRRHHRRVAPRCSPAVRRTAIRAPRPIPARPRHERRTMATLVTPRPRARAPSTRRRSCSRRAARPAASGST